MPHSSSTDHFPPADLSDLVLHLYADADWVGDPTTTKSTTGVWLELYSPTSGHAWVLSWATVKQTATASSTREAESVGMSVGLRRDALPVQILIDTLIGQRIPIIAHCDNAETLTAVSKGYSKKMRCLSRSQRVSIGAIHEMLNDTDMKVTAVYVNTAEQKGDMFTKALQAPEYIRQRLAIGIIPCSS